MRASHIDMFENVDIIQVGARNMQNFELLKELGKIDKPIPVSYTHLLPCPFLQQ